MPRKLVGLIGAAAPSQQGYEQALKIGRLLAESGLDMVCGGMSGIMEAASRGCSEAGGVVIGLLPTAEADSGNPFLTYALPTNLGHARNVLIAHAASALIAVEGEYGTLSEIAIALKLGRPVVGLRTPWDIPGVIPAVDAEHAVRLIEMSLEETA